MVETKKIEIFENSHGCSGDSSSTYLLLRADLRIALDRRDRIQHTIGHLLTYDRLKIRRFHHAFIFDVILMEKITRFAYNTLYFHRPSTFDEKGEESRHQSIKQPLKHTKKQE